MSRLLKYANEKLDEREFAETCLVVEVHDGCKRLASHTGWSAVCSHGYCPTKGPARVQISFPLEHINMTESVNGLYRAPHHRQLHGSLHVFALSASVPLDRSLPLKPRKARSLKRMFIYLEG